ncbi:hypothetical protein AMTRI_Chr11g96280 [Amborella trichopoda]
MVSKQKKTIVSKQKKTSGPKCRAAQKKTSCPKYRAVQKKTSCPDSGPCKRKHPAPVPPKRKHSLERAEQKQSFQFQFYAEDRSSQIAWSSCLLVISLISSIFNIHSPLYIAKRICVFFIKK